MFCWQQSTLTAMEDLTERYEGLMSEREDLTEQLDKQSNVMASVRKSLESFTGRNRDYVLLLSQVQLRGGFPPADDRHHRVDNEKVCWKNDDECLELRKRNRVAEAEIECLRARLKEVAEDHDVLSKSGGSNSNGDDDEKETEEQNPAVDPSIMDQLVQDVIRAGTIRDRLRKQTDECKERVESLNASVLDLLDQRRKGEEGGRRLDLENLLVQTQQMRKAVDRSSSSTSTFRRLSGRPPELVTDVRHVEKVLRLLSGSGASSLVSQRQGYLLNIARTMLQSLREKDEQIKIQDRVYESTHTYLCHMLKHCRDLSIDEPPSKSLDSRLKDKEPTISLKVDFEQPNVVAASAANYFKSYSETDETETVECHI